VADRLRMQDGLVDDVALAVPAPHRFEAIDAELREQGAVEARDLVPAVERFAWAPDHVVLGVRHEACRDRVEVRRLLCSVVPVDQSVHLGAVPRIGERYRGPDGHSGYLLRQAWNAFRNAMETALNKHGLNGAQYGALSVLARDPGSSGADLARACNTTPQAMNGVLATLEREGLIERRPHPTHGRILEVVATPEGERRLAAATPAVRRLEKAIEADLTDDQLDAVKSWLVAAARRLEEAR
jgi:DNA-binding MarR family transcriptional regulator